MANYKIKTFDTANNREKLRDSNLETFSFKDLEVLDLGTPSNYTAADDAITTHLQGIDSALAGAAGTDFSDSDFRVSDNGDASKKMAFEVSGVSASTTRTITMPDSNVDLGLVGTALQSSQLGAANGVAQLDASGKLPASQLTVSAMEYKGTWNASTNTPTLSDAGAFSTGDVYAVSVGGSQDLGSGSITFVAGDWVIFSGSTWQRVENSTAVASVNGQTGVVVLDTDDVSEGTAQYFTADRAKDAAGAALTDSASIDFTYDSGLKTITAVVKAASISEVELAASVAGDGLAGGAGSALSVNVDDSTIEINTDALRVKDLGISAGKIADDAVGKAKINSDIAGKGLQQASDGALETNVVKTLTNSDVASFSAGEFGLILADGSVSKADAQISGQNLGTSYVMALEAIASSASGKFAVGSYKLGGFSGLSEEAPVYLHLTTLGGYQQDLSSFSAGDHIVLLAQAVSDSELLFNPTYVAEF